MREDRPLPELLTANYTFVNERLARFYGIPECVWHAFPAGRRPIRAGPACWVTAAFSTVTSYATRTSPVLRGKLLLDNILGAPPPPPPPNVPPLAETSARERPEQSMRERMEAAPPEPDLRDVPPADGSAGIRAREFRCDREVADERRTSAHRRVGRASRWNEVRGPRRVPEGVDGAPRRVRPRVHGKALDVCHRPGDGATTTCRRSARSSGRRPQATTAGRPWFSES